MGENISTRVAYGRALAEFGADENIYVFDADLKKCTMTLYFSEKYPERFYNIGIISYNKYKSKYFFVFTPFFCPASSSLTLAFLFRQQLCQILFFLLGQISIR